MKKTKKIIGLGLSLAVLVTSVGFAFAADNQTQTADTTKPESRKMMQFKDRGNGKNMNLLSELVKAGTITADQQKAVQEALKSQKGTDKTTKELLDSLVTAGTITQAQEDAVVKAYDDARAKVEAEMQKRLEEMAAKKGITVDELKAQMEKAKEDKAQASNKRSIGNMGRNRMDILYDLVKAGTITADQQKAVQEALKSQKGTDKTTKELLDGLVTAGTITQAQEDAVIKAYDDARAKVEAEMQKRLEELAAKKGITVDELKAQLEKAKEDKAQAFDKRGMGNAGRNRIDILSELVKAGTITADQQKAVQEALKSQKGTDKTTKELLDSLVTAGTITQAQEDLVIKAYDDAKAKVEAEMQKRLEEMAAKKGITVDELKAQMEKLRTDKTNK